MRLQGGLHCLLTGMISLGWSMVYGLAIDYLIMADARTRRELTFLINRSGLRWSNTKKLRRSQCRDHKARVHPIFCALHCLYLLILTSLIHDHDIPCDFFLEMIPVRLRTE